MPADDDIAVQPGIMDLVHMRGLHDRSEAVSGFFPVHGIGVAVTVHRTNVRENGNKLSALAT